MKKFKLFVVIAVFILTVVPAFSNFETINEGKIIITPMIDDGWPGHG